MIQGYLFVVEEVDGGGDIGGRGMMGSLLCLPFCTLVRGNSRHFFCFLGVVRMGRLTGAVLILFVLVVVARCVFYTVSLWFLDVVFCSCVFLAPGVSVCC